MNFLSPTVLFSATAFLMTWVATWFMFTYFTKRLEDRLEQFLRNETNREQELRTRERLVVAAALEGELLANQTKLEAFILIYQELLRGVKEPGRGPKYKQGGEIIHDKPALARTIFEAYADRLELLGPELAGTLSKLYSEVETDPAYRTLSSDISADQATHIIERIIEGAREMIPPIEKTIAALRIIIRDKRRG